MKNRLFMFGISIYLLIISLCGCSLHIVSPEDVPYEGPIVNDQDIQFLKDGQVTLSSKNGDFNCILASGDDMYVLGKYLPGFNESHAELFIVNKYGDRLFDDIDVGDSFINTVKKNDGMYCRGDDVPAYITYLGSGLFGFNTDGDDNGVARKLVVYNVNTGTKFSVIDDSSVVYYFNYDPDMRHTFAGNNIAGIFHDNDYAVFQIGNKLELYSTEGLVDTVYEAHGYEEIWSVSKIVNDCFFYSTGDFHNRNVMDVVGKLRYYDIQEKHSHTICDDGTAIKTKVSEYEFNDDGVVIIERLGSDRETWYSAYRKLGKLSKPVKNKEELNIEESNEQ